MKTLYVVNIIFVIILQCIIAAKVPLKIKSNQNKTGFETAKKTVVKPLTININTKYDSAVTDFSNIPYLAAVVDFSSERAYASGVVLSKHYVLFRARDTKLFEEAVKTQDMLYVAGDMNTLFQFNNVPHKIKQIIYHPQYVETEINYDLAVCKICKSIVITKFIKLPPPTASYVVGTVLDLVKMNAPTYYMGDFSIAADTDCSATPMYDNNFHYCGLEGDISIVSQNTFNKAPFLLNAANDEFYGFAVSSVIGSGKTAFQKITVYKDWIQNYQ